MPRTSKQFEEIRERTKQTIIEAGLFIFARKGFYGATMAQIAKKAGISKGLIYNYFENKKELAGAILNQVVILMEGFGKVFEEIDDPYEILEALLKETFKTIRKNSEFWRLYVSFALQPEIIDEAQEIFSNVVKNYIVMVEKIFRKIRIPNAGMEAYEFAALLDGLGIDYLFDRESYPLKKLERHLLKKYSKDALLKRVEMKGRN